MRARTFGWRRFLALQVLFAGSLGAAYALTGPAAVTQFQEVLLEKSPVSPIAVPRHEPLRISPLYDRPDLVTDEQLAAVLKQVRPKFDRTGTKPNYVEHALRTWSIHATFDDPAVWSGAEMRDYLTDHAKFSSLWAEPVEPLVEDRPRGLSIRWGKEAGGSVHHDHWLACLTEAGVRLDHPVYGPARRNMTIDNVLQEAIRDFRLDEREYEWTALAFGLWIPPTREWIGSGGRQYSFDLLVDRLVRGDKQIGVCSGTHRVYSTMVLVRLDDEFDVLSDAARDKAWSYLEDVRDWIVQSQWDDGRWPSNWPEGEEARLNHIDEDIYKQVIATGHHLEWLAIAPRELHPPYKQIRKAADWIIAQTIESSEQDILDHYTFYSHVGNALAMWRNTQPHVFWRRWLDENRPRN